ncbi:GntP family permease [Aerococcaceae bacterium 50-4]
MYILGLIGLVLAIIAVITLSFRGLKMIIAAPLSALLIIVTNQMNIFGALVGPENSYMSGLANFLIKNFGIFLLGAILGQYMDRSGATKSIAASLLKRIGTDNPFRVLMALTFIGAILTYGGISLFVAFFTLIPLARPIFKELDINWSLVSLPLFFGAGTFTMSMLPGTPSIQNAVPTTVLGTNLMAAPLLGIIGFITMFIFGTWYMHFVLNRSLNRHETFYSYLENDEKKIRAAKEEEMSDDKPLPGFTISILPLVILISVIFLFSKVENIILIALTVTICICALLFNKYIDHHTGVLNDGATGAVGSAFGAASAVAFGAVLTTAPAFESVKNFLLRMPGPALISLGVITALLSPIMGATGAISTVITQLGQTYVSMGISPEVVHRVAVIAGGALTFVPQSGAVITFNAVSGLNFKHGFIHACILSNVGFIISLIAVIVAAQLLY